MEIKLEKNEYEHLLKIVATIKDELEISKASGIRIPDEDIELINNLHEMLVKQI